MLEIVRGRTWSQTQTVLDSADPLDFSDLTVFNSIISQIREKSATSVDGGPFIHALVTDVTVTLSGVTNSTINLSLTRAETYALIPGTYMIDIVASKADGSDENLMNPEMVLVTNRPSVIAGLDPEPDPDPEPEEPLYEIL